MYQSYRTVFQKFERLYGDGFAIRTNSSGMFYASKVMTA